MDQTPVIPLVMLSFIARSQSMSNWLKYVVLADFRRRPPAHTIILPQNYYHQGMRKRQNESIATDMGVIWYI